MGASVQHLATIEWTDHVKFRCNECMDRPYTCEAIDVDAGLRAVANHISIEHPEYQHDANTPWVEIQDITINVRSKP